MINAKARFGFIGYYINKELRRVPAQFFVVPTGRIAWLEGARIDNNHLLNEIDPIYVAVDREMDPHEIGNFADVMRFYHREALALFSETRVWQQCINSDAGVLTLFRAMHEMRTQGITALEGLAASTEKGLLLRESIEADEAELLAIFLDPLFSENPNAIIDIRKAEHREGVFTLA